MRIAICLYGTSKTVDTRGISIDWRHSYKNFVNFVVNKNYKFDVFIHTWSVAEEKDLKKYYKPKKILVEKSIFPNYFHNLDSNEFKDTGHYEPETKIQATYSRWDSECKCIDLKKQYELENNFVYDFVLSRRFDLLFYNNFIFEKLNKENFYTSNWHLFWKEKTKYFGYNDPWFLGGSKIIDKHANLYKNLNIYLKKDSEYFKYITEFLKMKKDEGISSHALSRYNLIYQNLISKERFLGEEYTTWNLTRKSHIRKNPHWKCPWPVTEPHCIIDDKINSF